MLDLPESKVKILNVGLLGMAFMLAFTAFNVSNKVTKIRILCVRSKDIFALLRYI